jgi:hypothetical protein
MVQLLQVQSFNGTLSCKCAVMILVPAAVLGANCSAERRCASPPTTRAKIIFGYVGQPTDSERPRLHVLLVLRWRCIVYATGDRVYSREELMLFRRVFESALALLPVQMRTDRNRSCIALSLLACAATGERDPVELRIAALAGLQAAVAA